MSAQKLIWLREMKEETTIGLQMDSQETKIPWIYLPRMLEAQHSKNALKLIVEEMSIR
jgi:hypothetical protein